MQSTCDVTVRAMPGSVVLDLSGELNSSAAGVLLPAYEQAVGEGDPRTVLIDFTDVDYINSTGIALVVGVLAKARAEGRTVVACGLTEHYREIFNITRLSDFMQMFSDVDSALGNLAGT
ncbi:MAG: STAS domain-containing protein [Actinomycetota bacterium]|nr:STAS domain-containing protein [Actinomycetota bacterium]